MKVSIREGTQGNSKALFVYRPYSRTDALASAWQTKSLMWIVACGSGYPVDVAIDQNEAREMLQRHFDGLKGVA